MDAVSAAISFILSSALEVLELLLQEIAIDAIRIAKAKNLIFFIFLV